MRFSIYLWGLAGSALAVGLETATKLTTISWLNLLPYTIIPILLLNYCLFRLLRISESLLSAFVVFALCNIILRMGATFFILHEEPKTGIWVALGLLIAAQIAKWSL